MPTALVLVNWNAWASTSDMIPPETATALDETPYTDYAHVAVAYAKNSSPDYPNDIVLPVGVGETRNVGAIVLHSRRNPDVMPLRGRRSRGHLLQHAATGEHERRRYPPRGGGSGGAGFRSRARAKLRSSVPLRSRPHRRLGHYGRLDAVHKTLPRRVFLAGDYFSQAGVEAAVFSGEKAALDLHKALGNEP